jgi:FkbM family methyltransferase
MVGIRKRRGVLIYLGLHTCGNFSQVFFRFKKCYGFEANPSLFESAKRKFRWFPNVHIYNKAVCKENGILKFNISNNRGASSSLGTFKKNWSNDIFMIKSIDVSSINLMDFLREKDINYIDEIITDIQGYDLEVLTTLKPLIDQKRIRLITCETTKDKYGNVYENAPDNSFGGFKKLLEPNYECISVGSGLLKSGVFEEVPDDWWEFDTKWKVKE